MLWSAHCQMIADGQKAAFVVLLDWVNWVLQQGALWDRLLMLPLVVACR